MKRIITVILSGLLLMGVSFGGTINTNCIGGTSASVLDFVMQSLQEKDYEAIAKLIVEGRAQTFEQGETVIVVGRAGWLGSMAQIRKRGETNVYMVPVEFVSE
jgi:hypothetical protein